MPRRSCKVPQDRIRFAAERAAGNPGLPETPRTQPRAPCRSSQLQRRPCLHISMLISTQWGQLVAPGTFQTGTPDVILVIFASLEHAVGDGALHLEVCEEAHDEHQGCVKVWLAAAPCDRLDPHGMAPVAEREVASVILGRVAPFTASTRVPSPEQER